MRCDLRTRDDFGFCESTAPAILHHRAERDARNWIDATAAEKRFAALGARPRGPAVGKIHVRRRHREQGSHGPFIFSGVRRQEENRNEQN